MQQPQPEEVDIIDCCLFAAMEPNPPSWDWVRALERLERRLVAEAGLYAEGLPDGVDPRLVGVLDKMAEAHFALSDYVRTRTKEAKKLVMGLIPATQTQTDGPSGLKPSALKLLSSPSIPVHYFQIEEEPTYDNAG